MLSLTFLASILKWPHLLNNHCCYSVTFWTRVQKGHDCVTVMSLNHKHTSCWFILMTISITGWGELVRGLTVFDSSIWDRSSGLALKWTSCGLLNGFNSDTSRRKPLSRVLWVRTDFTMCLGWIILHVATSRLVFQVVHLQPPFPVQTWSSDWYSTLSRPVY